MGTERLPFMNMSAPMPATLISSGAQSSLLPKKARKIKDEKKKMDAG